MPFANFLLGIGEYVVLFYVGSKVIAGEMGRGELSQFADLMSVCCTDRCAMLRSFPDV